MNTPSVLASEMRAEGQSSAYLQIEQDPVERQMCVVHFVLELERLRDEELEGEDIDRRSFDPRREGIDRDGKVFGFRREEDARQPAQRAIPHVSIKSITRSHATYMMFFGW